MVWEEARDCLLNAASEACGWTKAPPRHVQTWWWNEEVVKKSKFKAWSRAKGTAAEKAVLKDYVAAKKIAKKAVAQAQQW